jgi:hypothetical protein
MDDTLGRSLNERARSLAKLHVAGDDLVGHSILTARQKK